MAAKLAPRDFAARTANYAPMAANLSQMTADGRKCCADFAPMPTNFTPMAANFCANGRKLRPLAKFQLQLRNQVLVLASQPAAAPAPARAAEPASEPAPDLGSGLQVGFANSKPLLSTRNRTQPGINQGRVGKSITGQNTTPQPHLTQPVTQPN